MKTSRASFDRSSLEKKKIYMILIVLAVMWFALFPALICFINAFIESGALILIVLAVAATASVILGIMLMLLTKRKYDVTADDTSVKLISGNQVTEIRYSDIASVSYSFREVMDRIRYGSYDNRRYALLASIKMSNGNNIELYKDFGSVHRTHYTSAENMTELIGDKADETALLAYIRSRVGNK